MIKLIKGTAAHTFGKQRPSKTGSYPKWSAAIGRCAASRDSRTTARNGFELALPTLVWRSTKRVREE